MGESTLSWEGKLTGIFLTFQRSFLWHFISYFLSILTPLSLVCFLSPSLSLTSLVFPLSHTFDSCFAIKSVNTDRIAIVRSLLFSISLICHLFLAKLENNKINSIIKTGHTGNKSLYCSKLGQMHSK